MKTTMKTTMLNDDTINAMSDAAIFGLSDDSLTALANLSEYDAIPVLTDGLGDELDPHEFLGAIAEDQADDGCGEYIYLLPGGICIQLGHGASCVTRDASIRDCLAGWDCTNYGTPEDLLTAFGLAAIDESDAARADHLGPVKVWAAQHYYAGTCGAPRDGWVQNTDWDGYPNGNGPRVWDSYAEAAAWITEQEQGTYRLNHGEYSSPDYIIVAA